MNKRTIILEELSRDQIISIISLDENFVFSEVDLNVTIYFGRSLSLGYKFNTLDKICKYYISAPNEICFKSKGSMALVILESKSEHDLTKMKVKTESLNLA